MATMGGKQGRAKHARRQFTDEFQGGLDLTASALGGWVKQGRADRTKGATRLTTEERIELASCYRCRTSSAASHERA